MSRTWLLAIVLVLTLGCQSSQVAGADPVGPNLNEAFTLAGGQTATIKGANLDLRFTGVQEDSRCPTAVKCFWTGEARITIDAQTGGQKPTTLAFNTNPAPGQNIQTATASGYVIALQSLDPYPQTPDEATSLQDYRATLLVRKA